MNMLLPDKWKSSLDQLRGELSEVLSRWMRRDNHDDFPALASGFSWGLSLPRVNISEDDDEVTVTAELPGMEKDDFKVELVGSRLSIRGERRHEREKKDRHYHYSEIAYGSFSRSVQLPAEVDADKAKAEYKHGVLTLRLPKTESGKARRIPVRVG